VSQDYFLAAISQIRGEPVVSNRFEWRDIMTLDPNTPHVTRASILDTAKKMAVHQVGQTADWGSADRETVAATVLSQSVPALMLDVGITLLGFKSTNHDIGGQMNTIYYEAQSFSNTDHSQALEILKHNIEQYVLTGITFNNQISYALEMRVDLLGETWIKISLDGGPFIDYAVPQFCDASLVPVLTTNDQLAVQLAGDFEMLSTQLNAAAQESHPTLMSAGGSSFGVI
jgi:hypothetical protein